MMHRNPGRTGKKVSETGFGVTFIDRAADCGNGRSGPLSPSCGLRAFWHEGK